MLHPAPTCVQDGLDTLQLALVVFFICQIAHLHTLYKQPWHTFQLALCDGSGGGGGGCGGGGGGGDGGALTHAHLCLCV